VLVHVAYLRLVGAEQSKDWHACGQFFAAAAQAMRRILVDSAPRKRRTKHGGGRHPVELDHEVPEPPNDRDALLALDEALTRLAAEDLEAARIVQLRYLAGHSIKEAAHLDQPRCDHDAPVRDNDGRAGARLSENVDGDGDATSPGRPLAGAGSSR
jgi:RNA polymerase sigma factor (TIGR02999 family)